MITQYTDKMLYRIMSKIGIRHDLNGYIFIKDFIKDYLDSNTKLINVLEWYKTEASRLDTSSTKVERSIRQAAKIVEKSDNSENNKIFTDNIYSNKAFLLAIAHYAEAYCCENTELLS